MRFTCAVFGPTSRPFLLNETIKIKVSEYLPMPHYTDNVKKEILDINVDKSTKSFDNIGTAIEF